MTTPSGVKVPYTKTVVSRFDYTRDKLVFLSDIDWVKWEKNFGTGFSLEEPAKNVLSLWQRQALQLKSKRYEKGLSLRAGMSVETLPGKAGARFSRKAATPSRSSGPAPNSMESAPSMESSSNGSGAPPSNGAMRTH